MVCRIAWIQAAGQLKAGDTQRVAGAICEVRFNNPGGGQQKDHEQSDYQISLANLSLYPYLHETSVVGQPITVEKPGFFAPARVVESLLYQPQGRAGAVPKYTKNRLKLGAIELPVRCSIIRRRLQAKGCLLQHCGRFLTDN